MSVTPIDDLFNTAEAPNLGSQRRSAVRDAAEANAAAVQGCAALHIAGRKLDCLRALVLLWNDHLDAAHAIVQDLSGADPAFLHGIVHRREPDYSNARYWFQRAGTHAILEPLAEAAAPILAAHAALPYRLIRDGLWDPFAFVDAVLTATGRELTSEIELLRELQGQETRVLARYLCEA